jgi:hypothetical protein
MEPLVRVEGKFSVLLAPCQAYSEYIVLLLSRSTAVRSCWTWVKMGLFFSILFFEYFEGFSEHGIVHGITFYQENKR